MQSVWQSSCAGLACVCAGVVMGAEGKPLALEKAPEIMNSNR